ncbi:MAG: deoxyhypusine synthase [Desulfurococcales archaeon]|nr:deoxyhypusine synthase [Desulfurococcales archaeon]
MELEKVVDEGIHSDYDICRLIEYYRDIHGFMAGHLYRAIEILTQTLEKSRLRVLSFTGNLVATGLRGVLAQLVGSGLFDIVITTTGAVDHDIAKGSGGVYYKGFFESDDVDLYRKGYHRLGNIYIPLDSYGPVIEDFVRRLLDEAYSRGMKGRVGVSDLLNVSGSMINDNNSILRRAWERGVQVFLPGWPDGAFGTTLFTELQTRSYNLTVDYMVDMKKLAEFFFTRKGESTALIIGGGISKHHTIWWAQFRGGYDYAVYITTAVEYDGSLSGAHPREAITWGKLKTGSKSVVVYADATLVLPIITAGVLNKCIK